MKILPIATESMGTRSFCTLVHISPTFNILIDPSVALGPRRFGLKPHLDELAASYLTRQAINKLVEYSSVVIVSHYHGDHFTLGVDRIYEFTNKELQYHLYSTAPIIYAKTKTGISYNQKKRSYWLWKKQDYNVQPADGKQYEFDKCTLEFSQPVAHGAKGTKMGKVIMTKIVTDSHCFIYTSDVMGLLTEKATQFIADNNPDTVFLDGPSIYHPKTTETQKQQAVKNINSLKVSNLIIDHHSARMLEEKQWREKNLNKKTYNAAQYIKLGNYLLEAQRKKLHQEEPLDQHFYDKLEEHDTEIMDRIKMRAKEIPLNDYLDLEKGRLWDIIS